MSTFSVYFSLGLRHVSNIHSVEHILFLISLCAIYLMRDWKKVLILIVYYSIGYIATLVLGIFNVIQIPGEVTDYLMPLTILH